MHHGNETRLVEARRGLTTTFTVDEPATASLRESLRAARPPLKLIERGEYAERALSFKGGILTNSIVNGTWTGFANVVERIVLAGIAQEPRRVIMDGSSNHELEWAHDAATLVLTVRKPEVRMADAWAIKVE